MKIRSHTFRGKRWRVVFKAIKGQTGSCEPPDEPAKVLTLDPKVQGLEALDTAIHEACHACLWDLDEEAVTEIASDMARFLWRLGYRRQT